MKMCKALLCAAALFLLASALPAESAEKPKNFPRRPVSVIVPFGAGGGADQMARAFLPHVSKILGVPITVINKPGGNATVGFADFWNSPADGYTILQYNDDSITYNVNGVLKQDPTKDYVPLVFTMMVYSQVYIRANDTRFHDWDSFVAYAKANPGKVTLANVAQKGSGEDLLTVQLERAAGIKVRQISYDNPTERFASLVGGHVDCLMDQPAGMEVFMKSGDMKPIISLTNKRPEQFKDIPCLVELDPKASAVYKTRGFYMHGNIDKPIADFLAYAFKQAYLSPEFQEYIAKRYVLDTKYRDMEESKAFLRNMIEAYTDLYKQLGYETAR